MTRTLPAAAAAIRSSESAARTASVDDNSDTNRHRNK